MFRVFLDHFTTLDAQGAEDELDGMSLRGSMVQAPTRRVVSDTLILGLLRCGTIVDTWPTWPFSHVW